MKIIKVAKKETNEKPTPKSRLRCINIATTTNKKPKSRILKIAKRKIDNKNT